MTSGSQTNVIATIDVVAGLVEEFCGRVEAGESIDPASFAAEYPEHAGALLEVLPAAAAMAALGDAGSASASSFDGEGIPGAGMLGDFRISREIGRGGMGIVYEAEQASLGRRVALKVLPRHAARDAKQLARFQVEAHAVASLNHPNIVPIFAVGRDRGVPYYAMQLIEGQSLAQVIRERREQSTRAGDGGPEWGPGQVARLGLQAAEALAHAHAMGVLHRDIKPANMLVDSRNHLWIVDFGLARIHADSDLTLSGDVLGTLRYMSPEQAQARGVIDERSDVYSLGATLYELLLLRPAFEGRRREHLLRQVVGDEPIPPRKIAPGIPRDLETIILNTMAKEPGQRYESALALKEDLVRFLDERPIVARRASLQERAARWMKRHRTAVTATAAALVLAMVALIAGNFVLWKERSLAKSNLGHALEALDRLHLYLAGDGLSTNPEQATAIIESLRKDLDLYEKFASENPDDQQARWGAARAYRRMGDIQARFPTMVARAEAAYRAADRFLNQVLQKDPENVSYRDERAELLGHLGKLLYMLGGQRGLEGLRAAEAPLRQSLAIDDVLMVENPRGREYQRRFAQNSLYFSGVLFVADRLTEREQTLSRLDGILQNLDPRSPEERLDVAVLHKLYGDLMHATARPDEGARAYDRSVSLLGSLSSEPIAGPGYRQSIVGLFRRLGQLSFCRSNQPEKETGYYARALPVWDRHIAAMNLTPAECYLRADAHLYVGYLFMRNHEEHHAATVLSRAVELFDLLFRAHPSVDDYRIALARGSQELGRLLMALERPGEAMPYLERSMTLRPDDRTARADNLWYLTIYPNPSPRRALELAQELVAAEPDRAECWSRLGAARVRAGDFSGAQEALEHVMRMADGGDPDDWLFLAMSLWNRGETASARVSYDKAARAIDQMPKPRSAALARLRNEVATLVGATNLGRHE